MTDRTTELLALTGVAGVAFVLLNRKRYQRCLLRELKRTFSVTDTSAQSSMKRKSAEVHCSRGWPLEK